MHQGASTVEISIAELRALVNCSKPFFPKIKATFADHVIQERITRQSGLDWIIVRPSKLTDGPKTGHYKAGVHLSMGMSAKISRADVADFLLKQVYDDTYLHQVAGLK